MNATRHRIPQPSPSALLLVLAGVIGSPSAQAQEITTDPTRPAVGLVVEAPEGAAAPANQLQSVVISPTRRAAMINGVVVEQGQKYGDAVLMRVAEDRVVLKSGTSQQVLKLYPAVEKVGPKPIEPVAPAAETSAPRKAKAKAKPKAAQKAKTKPAAKPPSGTKPAADSSAGTR
jgi:hypothetical protein